MLHCNAPHRPLDKLAVGAILLLGSVIATCAQCAPLRFDPSKLPAHNGRRERLLPESGYLSNTTYTNNYFGFSLDLPINAQGHLVKLPLMPERQHALLAIAYQNGDRSGSLTIDAIEPREGLEGFSAKQQEQQLTAPGPQPGQQNETLPQVGAQGTLVAPLPQLGAPQFQIPSERFHSSEQHKGEKYTATYRTQIKNYRVGVLIATNDKDFLRKSKQAMAAMRFYCTAGDGILATKDGNLVTPDGERYEGPTVPTWRADIAIQSNVGLTIPPGEVRDRVYHSSDLGLQYELPQGWEVLPTHNGGNPPADPAFLREFEFLHACSRTLLRIQQRGSGDAGPGRRPMIVLRALDPKCLSMRIPVAPSDTATAEEVGVSLEALLEFGQVASHQLATVSDRLFIVFYGTIAAPAEGEQLAQRMSQTMFATQQNRMLLLWSFMAPTSTELATMPASGIRFDGAESIQLSSALAAK
ncbi:MAG: hypothetical protein ACLPND_13305 [Candidatus Korobacteraceae bacterium]